MSKELWILQQDTSKEGYEGLPVFYCFDEKLKLTLVQKQDLHRLVMGTSNNLRDRDENVRQVEVHDFYIVVGVKDTAVDSITDRVSRGLAAFLGWDQLPKRSYLAQDTFAKLRDQKRFDRKWNVKL